MALHLLHLLQLAALTPPQLPPSLPDEPANLPDEPSLPPTRPPADGFRLADARDTPGASTVGTIRVLFEGRFPATALVQRVPGPPAPTERLANRLSTNPPTAAGGRPPSPAT